MNPQPNSYAAFNIVQEESTLNLLAELHENEKTLINNQIVVDIGCGVGNITKGCLKIFGPSNIIAFDFNKSMIEFCRKHNFNSQIKFEVGNIDDNIEKLRNDINFHEEANLVISTWCLHWVKNKLNAFENVFKLLKKGGKCYISLMLFSDLFPIQREFILNSKWLKFIEKKYQNTRDENNNQNIPICLRSCAPTNELVISHWSTILNHCGFHNYNVSVRKQTINYDNFDQFKGLWSTLIPIDCFLPADMKEEFMNDLFTFINEQFYKALNSPIYSTYTLLVIKATK